MDVVNLAVTGSTGRMGSLIIKEAAVDQGFNLTQALVKDGSENVGKHINPYTESKFVGSSNIEPTFDVLIDFSAVSAMDYYVAKCVQYLRPMVIGVTDLSVKQMEKLEYASQSIPILFAPNMSIGVNLCYKIIENCSKMLSKDWQVAIHDVHHKNKKDSPSGTSLEMAKVLIEASTEKGIDDIQFSSVRGGDVHGEHTLSFLNDGERIEITHKATDRAIFARGALTAAKWIKSKKPGLYNMQDIISSSLIS